MPSLKGRFNASLAQGNDQQVRRSCIHCHTVQEAGRATHRLAGEPVPNDVLYPYPMPDAVGLSLDPKQRATVKEVRADSPAQKAGFRTGDEIARLNGQPIISIADVQWVLHHAKDGDTLRAEVRRDGKPVELSVKLPEGWRRTDISWRPSTWDLRRMALGGLVLEDVTDAERKERKLPAEGMAFRIKHIGQFGQHAAAKNAGFRNEDLVVAVDGREGRLSESALIEELLRARKPGERVDVKVLRDGKGVTLKLPMQ
jgi:serine protease Do